jgi:hypothetical protein
MRFRSGLRALSDEIDFEVVETSLGTGNSFLRSSGIR